MKKEKFPIILLFIILVSCNNKEQIIDNPKEQFYICDILGTVENEFISKVEGATVSFNGKTTKTDKRGIYVLNSVEVSSKHNKLIISMDNYFDGIKVFISGQNAQICQRTVLFRKDYGSGFNTNSGGKITGGNVSMEYSANSIVLAGGITASGNAFIRNIDPDSFREAPGAFVGHNFNDELTKLNPYCVGFIDIKTAQDAKLDIKKGESVILKLRMPWSMQSNAPDKLSTWSFNIETGYWKEEGTAIREGDQYVANISHLGYWSFCTSEPAVILSGKFVANKSPLTLPVTFLLTTEPWRLQSEIYSNYDGTFSIWAEKNATLRLKNIHSGSIQSESFGPFKTETNLGEVQFSIPQSAHVSGSVNDCDGNPLKNGYVICTSVFYSDSYIPVKNGKFSNIVSTQIIGENFAYIGVDLDNLEEGKPMYLPIPNDTDIGTIKACIF